MAKKKKVRVSGESKIEDEEMDNHHEDAEMDDCGESSSAKDTSLYEVLGVERTATQQEIKKAYHKLALRVHPDKNPDDKEAKEKFQQLQKVISILGDEEKRALYDQTGIVDDDDLAGETVENLQNFFRAMYKKVTVEDIEEFEANYRGSDTEKRDLINLYKECKGNMKRLFCSMLCSDPKLDSHRFKDILVEAIASVFYHRLPNIVVNGGATATTMESIDLSDLGATGELKEFKAYKKWAKEVSEIKPPTSPLKRREKSKKQSDSDLYAIIAKRRDERKDRLDSMFSSMMAKYGGQDASEPTDEEFEAAQKRLETKRASKQSRKK